MKPKYDVIIVGGGATGAGIARDCALRGFQTLLLEKDDLSEGTTGRCHAMLHSGARYVYKDAEAARECVQEAEIVLKIAPHISQACGGYFLGIDQQDFEYAPKFVNACKIAGVPFEESTPAELFKAEPNANPATQIVYKVKDGYVDPFLLTIYNAYDAQLHGATIRTYCEAKRLIIRDHRIIGVQVYDKIKNRTEDLFAEIVVNATGPWAGRLDRDLKLSSPLQIAPTKGVLLVIKPRLVNSLLNRLRPPGDGDIIVPSHQSVLLGTTSIPVHENELDALNPTADEIENLLQMGESLIPSIRKYRVIRYYAGARPLVASQGSLREASRKFDIIDYEKQGYFGFITIFGGKMTTYRLMAEQTVDLICQKLGTKSKCSTAHLALPGGDRPITNADFKALLHVDDKAAGEMALKWGTFYEEMQNLCHTCTDGYAAIGEPRMICECENVTEPELAWVQQNLDPVHLDDYRRRTRQGMGPCQGQFCYYKIANLEAGWTSKSHDQIINELQVALHKRWKTEAAGDPMLQRQIKLSKYMYLMGGNLE
jgi:glycerol-3-phosphate dehydrogenase